MTGRRLNARAQAILDRATAQTQGLEPELLFAGVLAALIDEVWLRSVLENLDMDPVRLHQALGQRIASGRKPSAENEASTTLVEQLVASSQEEARALGEEDIHPQALLLGLLRAVENACPHLLAELSLNAAEIRRETLALSASSHKVHDVKDDVSSPAHSLPPSSTPALDAFARNLTELAKQHKLDPVIGREQEVERLIQILGRREKRHAVLIGEEGVGKTAIVERLAQYVAEGDVPEFLCDKRIVILDMAAIVSGAKYRGQVEERMKAVLHELARERNAILFIDDVDKLIRGTKEEAAFDGGYLVAAALRRGELQCLLAATPDAWRANQPRLGALASHFDSIVVEPTSPEQTLEVLRGLRSLYEQHHQVRITDEAIAAAVELSCQFLPERFLPDKAIDVIDEACARIRLRAARAEEAKRPLLSQSERETLREQREDALARCDFEAAALLQQQIETPRAQEAPTERELAGESQLSDAVVSDDAIRQTIAEICGMTCEPMTSHERSPLVELEDRLRDQVIGHADAIQRIAKVLRRNRMGLRHSDRPFGSFVFAGTCVSGKTQVTAALAEHLFGKLDAVIRRDMTEFSDATPATSLFAPSNNDYVGYETRLTDELRRWNGGVLLLNQIERAHPLIFDKLHQILTTGRLTCPNGQEIDFRNIVLIMTTEWTWEHLGFPSQGDGLPVLSDNRVFPQRFLAAVDQLIYFESPHAEDVRRAISRSLAAIRERLNLRGIQLEVTEDTINSFIHMNSKSDRGEVPWKWLIKKLIEDPLVEYLFVSAAHGGRTVVVTPTRGSDFEPRFQFTTKANDKNQDS